jgi:Flp pilus assembly protein TadG
MRAAKLAAGTGRILQKQRGGAAVEFALVVIIFLTLIFGIMELARAMYICNTLQEVTRRAAALAANTDFSDTAAMQRVRERAIFRTAPGFLTFANPITDRHINIDYLAVTPNGASLVTAPIPKGSLPADPARNQEVCTGNPNDAACIRLVRVRICLPGGGGCDPVPYQSIVSLIPIPFPLPESTTIVTAETLGRPAGIAPAP